MLNADLVTVRRHKGELKLIGLDDEARLRARGLAATLVELARSHVGQTREEYEAALSAVDVKARERRLWDGLCKLVEDRCDFDVVDGIAPDELRREVFEKAAVARKGGHVTDRERDRGGGSSGCARGGGKPPPIDRAGILRDIAAARGLCVESLERGLYADLRGAHVLRGVGVGSPAALVDGYDLAQAQAVLLRATRVRVVVRCDGPGAYRALFGKLKFLRLLHTISPVIDEKGFAGGYRIDIDGPFSLFESVTKYGLQLAMMLPALAACDAWKLEADVRWGRERTALMFRLSGGREDGEGAVAVRLPDELTTLVDALHALSTAWRARPCDEILTAQRGSGLCVPDLICENGKTGEVVYVEALGYWSREAVWKRVDLVRAGLPARVVFAVGEHLRVSEAVLDDPELPGELWVYKRTMSARALVERLD